tara:strand:- start:977 stop:1306 length:330 start_codon:yes stop_codon:yes gene_type:complete
MTDTFFTPESIFSVASASVMILAVTTALDNFIGIKPKITAFFFSQIIALVNVIVSDNPTLINWFLIFFNGCLLYCTALGLNHSFTPTQGSGAGVLASPKSQDRRKFRRW